MCVRACVCKNYRAGPWTRAKISQVLLLHGDLEHRSIVTTFFCRDLYSYLKLRTHNMQMHRAKKYTFLAETEDVIMCAVNGDVYVYKIRAHMLTGRLSPLKPHINSPDRNWNFAHIPRMNRLLMCCVCTDGVLKKTKQTIEWVTRLRELSDSQAWPQRNLGLHLPFEHDIILFVAVDNIY